ncbi:hypothetical protein PYW08_011203 [Mythimna loreyi]|uniref:Uncharacterized protein n=1 Tax=Mythimna loreyi TaxID=667449 RepID=A0ACC2Q4K0_9NEOP|nr:hypothetical protein PYW08_011203 [Mythimna loreyi]
MKPLYLLIFGVIFCYVDGSAIDELFPRGVDYRCLQPIESGQNSKKVYCMAHMPMFGYDSDTEECVSFIYGGCGGNDNRFYNKNQCERHCGRKKRYRPRVNKLSNY